MMDEKDTTLEAFTVTTANSRNQLNKRQQLDYTEQREAFIRWLFHIGKDPETHEGYSRDTTERTARRTDLFARWVWNDKERYTATFTHEHADEYMEELAYSDYSNSHKANTQKALKRYFRWLANERGERPWTPERNFSTPNPGNSHPRDYLTKNERKRIREAALEYGSIPHYKSVSPEERDDWKTYLAQRFGKPKPEITPDDWKEANGWKFTTLVWVSLDAGLRPVEVERATTSWIDIDNGVLRIPKDDSAKNRGNWIIGLTDRTTSALDHWLEERDLYDRYENTDRIWLTRRGNPYQSQSLRQLLIRLCDIAGISTANRKISWFTIRHSTGTYMTREEDLAAAQAQLRHKSSQTTMQYDQTPVEDRRDALDRMG